MIATAIATVQTQEYTYFPGKTAPLHTLHPRNPNRGIPRKETQPERDFLRGELQLIQPKGQQLVQPIHMNAPFYQGSRKNGQPCISRKKRCSVFFAISIETLLLRLVFTRGQVNTAPFSQKPFINSVKSVATQKNTCDEQYD